MRWLLILPFLLLIAQTGRAAPPPTRSEVIFANLMKEVQTLTETFGKDGVITADYTTASKALVAKAANDLKTEIERAGPDQLLAPEPNREVSLWLGVSVYWGLVEILDVLLEYPAAKTQVNGSFGQDSLWSVAAVGGAQSVRVCGDTHLDIGAMIFPGYYGSDPQQSPFITVRRKLEAAGATARPEEARRRWLNQCRPREPITLMHPNGTTESFTPEGPTEYIPGARDRVANAPDILGAILAEIQSQVTPQGLPMPRF